LVDQRGIWKGALLRVKLEGTLKLTSDRREGASISEKMSLARKDEF